MKRIIKIKEGTKLYDLTIYLLTKGSAYKKDLLLYANTLCGEPSSASKLVKELEKRGYIYYEDITIDKRLKKKFVYHKKSRHRVPHAISVPVAFLSDLAFTQLEKILDSPMAYYRNLAKQFHSKQYDRVSKLYLQNHIKTLFNTVGVYTDEMTRPNLAMAYCKLHNTPYKSKNAYNTTLNVWEDIDFYLQKGVYFSCDDVRYFAKNYLEIQESITSVFRGIFISYDKLYVIYSNGKNNYSMIYLRYIDGEWKLLEFLQKCGFYNCNKIINVSTGPCALIVSDSKAFIYSTASGQTSGQTTKFNKGNKSFILTPKHKLFNPTDERYDYWYRALFCVTEHSCDIEKLDYLLSTTLKKHIKNTQSIKLDPKYQVRNNINNATFPISVEYKGLWYYAIFMPIYELTTLVQLRDKDTYEIIITFPEMVNTILHITHKQHIFFDITTGQLIDSNDSYIYDADGYIKGKKMIQDYLASMGKSLTAAQYHKLPTLYSQTPEQFFNSIAEGKIEPSKIIELIKSFDWTLSDYNPKRYRRKKTTLSINKDCHAMIVEYAKKHKISITTATERVFTKALKEE